jgi:hypothetical protein
LLFSRQALARAMPPHGGTPGSQNHRQGRIKMIGTPWGQSPWNYWGQSLWNFLT